MNHRHTDPLFAAVLFLLLTAVAPAEAYVGPGLGLTAIGSALAFLGAMVLAIIGFIWYPLKRLFGRSTPRDEVDGDLEAEGDDEPRS